MPAVVGLVWAAGPAGTYGEIGDPPRVRPPYVRNIVKSFRDRLADVDDVRRAQQEAMAGGPGLKETDGKPLRAVGHVRGFRGRLA